MQMQSFLRGNRTGGKGLNAETFPLFVLVTATFWHLELNVVKGMSQADLGPILGPAPIM